MKHTRAITLMGIPILICLTLVAGHVAEGQTEKDRLAPHIAWVMVEGNPSSESAHVTKLLGLGDAELPVFLMAFRKKDLTFAHAFEVIKESNPAVVIMVHKTPGRGIAWRTSKAGDIVSTVRIDYTDNGNSYHLVPNADYADLFAEELKYWDRHNPKTAKPPEK